MSDFSLNENALIRCEKLTIKDKWESSKSIIQKHMKR